MSCQENLNQKLSSGTGTPQPNSVRRCSITQVGIDSFNSKRLSVSRNDKGVPMKAISLNFGAMSEAENNTTTTDEHSNTVSMERKLSNQRKKWSIRSQQAT